MNKHKKHSSKVGGLGKKGQTSTREKRSTTYTLELLESRVLLSADLAGAVQAVPVNQVTVPQQALVHVQTAAEAGQQTFSVSEMLGKPFSSFHQRSNEADQGSSHGNESSAGRASSQTPSQDTRTVSEILGQQQQSQTQVSAQSNKGSQLQTASLNSSSTQTQTQSIATPVMSTLQSQTTLPPAVQAQTLTDAQTLALQTQQPTTPVPTQLTDAQILALQTQQPTTQVPTQLTEAQTLALQTQQPITQTPTQLTGAQTLALQTPQPITQAPTQLTNAQIVALQTQQPVTQSVQSQTQSVSQGLVPAPATQTTPVSATPNSIAPTNGAINPQLPQATVDTTMPTTTVTVRVGPHGDYTDLQTALNNVSLGTTILLEPGVSYTTTNELGFVLPNKTTGTGWIVIRPDMPDSAMPAPGTRVTPADSAWMPKIVRGNGNLYAISSEAGAHNYRIIGVEVMNQGNADTALVGAAFVNLTSIQETSLAAQSHHILFDRMYVHGPSAGGSIGVKFGILFGGQYEGVIDSTVEDITYGSDAIAVGSWSGAGPFVIRNNALSSSGENIMFGGADTQISGLVPSDIEVRGNYIYKPLKWRDDPAYNSGPNKILVKNLFETKNSQRVLIDGNVLENMWPGAQAGFAFTLTPRQAEAGSTQPWTIVQDITITNNIIKNTANGFAISGQDFGTWASPAVPTSLGGRILIKNNLLINNGGYPGTGKIFQLGNGVFDVTIQHNTVVSSIDLVGTTLMFTYGSANEDYTPMERFVLQDNLFQARSYPYHAEGGLTAAIPGYLWTNNVFIGPWPTSEGVTASTMPQGNGNAYPAGEANVGYVNLAGGDYRLSAISPYKGAASDGKDIGVDWDQFNAANS